MESSTWYLEVDVAAIIPIFIVQETEREGDGIRVAHQPLRHMLLLLVQLPNSVINLMILKYEKNWDHLRGVSRPDWRSTQRERDI